MVSDNRHITATFQTLFACCEFVISISALSPVSLSHPVRVFLAVSPFSPLPQFEADVIVHFVEGLLCANARMVVAPP